jgi:hypothetical protein
LSALGNALAYILVVNGRVVGAWQRTIRKEAVVIRTNIFRRLTKTETRAVAGAAQQYGKFLELPVALPP